MYKYSKSKNCFFYVGLGGEIPSDAVEVSDEQHSDLLDALSTGTVSLSSDKKGYPILIENPVPTIDQRRAGMQLSAAEARKRLAKAGLLLGIIERINAIPDDANIKIMWEYETVFKRLDPVLVDFCKGTLGLTDLQLDELFN